MPLPSQGNWFCLDFNEIQFLERSGVWSWLTKLSCRFLVLQGLCLPTAWFKLRYTKMPQKRMQSEMFRFLIKRKRHVNLCNGQLLYRSVDFTKEPARSISNSCRYSPQTWKRNKPLVSRHIHAIGNGCNCAIVFHCCCRSSAISALFVAVYCLSPL